MRNLKNVTVLLLFERGIKDTCHARVSWSEFSCAESLSYIIIVENKIKKHNKDENIKIK